MICKHINTILIITILLFFVSKTVCSQDILINEDSIFIDVKSNVFPGNRLSLTHSMILNKHYYCILKEQSLHSYKKGKKHFISIDPITKEVEWLNFPKKMKDLIHFDLYERNSKILIFSYNQNKCYTYNIAKDKWFVKSNCNDVVYVDNKYKIAHQDHGEWGKHTYFLNLETGKEYVVEEDGKRVNKLNERYYLSSDGIIIEIESPELLKECKKGCYFSRSINLPIDTTVYCKFNTLYNDSLSSLDIQFGMNRELRIESSWILENQLFQLYSTDTTTEIGKVSNFEIVSILKLPEKLNIQKNSHAYRGNSNYNDRIFYHYKKNENRYGFIDIRKEKVNLINLIHNQDSLTHFNYSVFDSYWDIFNQLDKVVAEEIRLFELESGGVKLDEDRTGRLNGLHPKEIVTKKSKFESYIKVENQYISQIVQYHLDKDDNVKSIFFEWSETNPYKTQYSFRHFFQPDKYKIDAFESKYNYLFRFITEKTNVNPIIDEKSNNSKTVTWKINDNHEIKIFVPKDLSRNSEIQMIIF